MSQRKILCIDDSVNLLQVLKKRFEFEFQNLSVFTANNGEDGLRIARTECVDLIFLDINMPGMNGDKVLQELKHPSNLAQGEFDTRGVPIVILTSHGPELRSKYLAAGARDYISSPFDTNSLVEKVRTILF